MCRASAQKARVVALMQLSCSTKCIENWPVETTRWACFTHQRPTTVSTDHWLLREVVLQADDVREFPQTETEVSTVPVNSVVAEGCSTPGGTGRESMGRLDGALFRMVSRQNVLFTVAQLCT